MLNQETERPISYNCWNNDYTVVSGHIRQPIISQMRERDLATAMVNILSHIVVDIPYQVVTYVVVVITLNNQSGFICEEQQQH